MTRRRWSPTAVTAWLISSCVLLTLADVSLSTSRGQETTGPTADVQDQDQGGEAPTVDSQPLVRTETRQAINLGSLLVRGGFFMIPIGLMSLLVVTIVVERALALRRNRILPGELIAQLGQLGSSTAGFDPREAYRICQRLPSSAARVIRSMLLKVGRPHSEVEHAVAEASQREADRLHANVRWLTLAAAVTPLLGLLGTVWGMIRAFHDTTQLAPGQNKADYLAEGIYVALVTTLGGLIVAIPAAFFAHYFEGRIQALFHQIDELLFNLMPQIERYEGRVRFNRPASDGDSAAAVEPPVAKSVADN